MRINFQTYSNANKIAIKRSKKEPVCILHQEKGNQKNASDVSFKGFLNDFLVYITNKNLQPETVEKVQGDYEVTDFHKALSEGILAENRKIIPPENFHNILSADEFREIIPTLKEGNFIHPELNKGNGVYFADLDTNTNFSDGQDPIFLILDFAACYADKFYEKTKKDLILAVTDRDCINGVQHAVRIIGENPERYKHLKFIPAVKLTIPEKDTSNPTGFRNTDVIVYGFNPFSANVNNYMDSFLKDRYKTVMSFIKRVATLHPNFSSVIKDFNSEDHLRIRLKDSVSGLYWRAKDYEEKRPVTEELSPEDKDFAEREAEFELRRTDLYENPDHIEDYCNNKLHDIFLPEDEQNSEENKTAAFEKMIECFDKEPQKPVIAVSAPYYLSHYTGMDENDDFTKVADYINELKDKSKGMLVAFESIVPRYSKDTKLKAKTVRKLNNCLRENTNMYEVGGSLLNRIDILKKTNSII